MFNNFTEDPETKNYLSQPRNDFNSFQAIGPLSTNNNSYETDLLEKLVLLPPAAFLLFIELKRSFNYKNNSVLYPKKFSNKTTSGYKLYSRNTVILIKSGLIKKITPKWLKKLDLVNTNYNYLLNPEFMKCTNLDTARVMWLDLK